MSVQIGQPYTTMHDKYGRTLDNGLVYIGTAGQNAELYPIQIFYDENFTIPAPQPLRTINGFFSRNGSPAKIFIQNSECSIIVKDRFRILQWLDLNYTGILSGKGIKASDVIDSSGKTQQEINDDFKRKIVNVDDFKTLTNTDAQAFKLAIDYCKLKNINNLSVTRNMNINEQLFISQDNLTIDFNNTTMTWTGQGQDNLRFAMFTVQGVLSVTRNYVTVPQNGYETTLTIDDASAYNVGDDIILKSTTGTTPWIYLGQVVRIVAKNGNTLTVDTIIHLSLDTTCYVSPVKMVNNTHLINVTFTATNQTVRANGVSGIMFEYTFGCTSNASCYGLWFKALRVTRSNNFTITGGFYRKPAAVEGGEGYGSQFDYCVNSYARGLVAYNMRHCIDVTASWGIDIQDCYDYYSMSASYGTHKAYEYNVTYENCHSIASYEHGFHFGSAQFLFGQTATKIKMKNCSVLRSRNIPLTFTTLGNWLVLEDCILDPISASGIYSAVLANNDVEFINVRCTAGISVIPVGTANAYTGGYCKFTDSTVNANANVARSFVLGAGSSISYIGGSLNGMVTPRANCVIDMTNCAWSTASVSGWLDTLQDNTQTVILDNVKLQAVHTAIANYAYDWKVKDLRFNNVKFDVATSITNKHKMSNTTTTINNSFGAVSFVLDGTNATRFSFNGNNFTAVSANEIIASSGSYVLTCPVSISDNTLICATTANTAVNLGSVGMLIPRLSLQNNSGVGILRVLNNYVTKCVVMGNTIDGVHVLPTADATNKFVQANL